MKKNNIAIVLINYKDYARRFLKECYKSLCAQSYKNFDIYIGDNESTKTSQNYLKRVAPTAIIVANEKNLGWAGGNNSVIKKEINNYDYFVVLNMDTVLDKDWLKNLIEHVKNHDLKLAQSKILIYKENKINSLGNRINYLGFGYCNCYGQSKDYIPKDNECQIDYLSGASMLVKSDVFKKIGYFRKEFFMYHDDLEFCWRARLAGYKIGLAEKSICYHKYSFESTLNQIYFMERNRLLTIFTMEKIWSIILIVPMLIPFELAMLLYLGLQGKFFQKLKALIYPFTPKGIRYIKNVRNEVNNYRIVKDSEIIKNFSGIIEFSEIKNPVLDKIANPILSIYWGLIKSLII